MNPNNPTDDDLDRLKADLGEAARDLSPEEFDRVVETLAWADTPSVEAPDSLKDRTFDALPSQDITSLPAPETRPSSFPVFIPWAAAAALAVAAIMLWEKNSTLTEVIDVKEAHIDELAGEQKRLLASIAEFEENQKLDRLKIVSLQSEINSAYFGAAVWDGQNGRGLLQVSRIPKLEAGKDYQLWIVDPKYKTPVDGGVFQVDDDGAATITFTPKQKIDEVKAFAVSLEKKGGVPVAEGPMVLVGAL